MHFKHKRKHILLFIMLVVVLIITACSNNSSPVDKDSLLLVESTITDGNYVASDLIEIVFTFSNDISNLELSIDDLTNGESIQFNHSINGQKVIIKDFILTPTHSYRLLYNVKDINGKIIQGSINFLVKRDTYPVVSGLNQTMMQAFYWEMNEGDYASDHPEEANLWNLLTDRAPELADVGITALWFPPANKGMSGIHDVGYGTYDLWDLGEFDQKGTIRTKYGTKNELDAAITALHSQEINVYSDADLNHRMGADGTEMVNLSSNNPDKPGQKIEAWTVFDFPGRNNQYSNFKWDWYCFDGTDWDQQIGTSGKYLFEGKTWDDTYYFDDDYLMGADVDYQKQGVQDDVTAWGKWIVSEIDFDGFRLDAVKHIDNNFINQWINVVQNNSSKDVFFVGEAWIEDVNQLTGFLDNVSNSNLKVFDFPLRDIFVEMVFDTDLSRLGTVGLVNKPGYEDRAVTFVDNHDTDRDEDSYSTSIYKRKYQAYAYILTRAEGLPTVYWKDYYIWGMKEGIDKILTARKYFAYGSGHEMEDDPGNDPNDQDVYSYVRSGSSGVDGDGLVMMISDGTAGEIVEKHINSYQPDTEFYDLTGNIVNHVVTDNIGYGDFMVRKDEETGWSIWVPVN